MTITVHNVTTGYRFQHENLSQAQVNHILTWLSEAKQVGHRIVVEVTAYPTPEEIQEYAQIWSTEFFNLDEAKRQARFLLSCVGDFNATLNSKVDKAILREVLDLQEIVK